MRSALYIGRLEHRRFAPRPHDFRYPLYMMWLDLGELDRVFRGRWLWSTSRPAVAWLRRADYLGDARRPLADAVRDLVEQRTGERPSGPIRLLTHLRTFGSCFNPVSFYYCYEPSGERIETIVAQVTNTPWNERHAYVLPAAEARISGETLRFRLAKAFHVSPFMPMDLAYDWRFAVPGPRLAVHMQIAHGSGTIFDATLDLKRREITGRALAGVLLRWPWMSASVLRSIYWQALRLWWLGTPFHAHPRRRSQSGTPLNAGESR